MQILESLQQQILSLSGYKAAGVKDNGPYLGVINQAFPNHRFPTGAIHECICSNVEDYVASAGFVSAVFSLFKAPGYMFWITPGRSIFPYALHRSGIDLSRCFFLHVQASKSRLSALEEVLRCQQVTAVVADVSDISFTESRRLQLSVEQSGVTGFLLRTAPKNLSTSAIARWKISSLPSENDGIPGVGFPKWKVELLRVRNGQPGSWEMVWKNGCFETEVPRMDLIQWQHRKVV